MKCDRLTRRAVFRLLIELQSGDPAYQRIGRVEKCDATGHFNVFVDYPCSRLVATIGLEGQTVKDIDAQRDNCMRYGLP